ncbi:hypothetical protein FHS85_004730 [Rhodoligotrophos appendicifer]|uniref:hypothetical protein n=1 Tax=Rhodoligotrophos appendicifer TaxID=987056 RepID=UPI0011871541|nr:hypothetical protein [Rhodoligotrophos appendicifer]
MTVVKFLGLLALGLSVSGCATIVNGTTQSIAIATPPVSGAQCDLSSSEGKWSVVTPGVVTVSRSKSAIDIQCNAPGYQTAVSLIPSNFEGWTAGNLVFGGVIGLGVDAATGAMNQYPGAFQVPMTPISPGSLPPKPHKGVPVS